MAMSSQPRTIQGLLFKSERGLGGPRSYWVVGSEERPLLFWYKAKGDLVPVAKAALSGAVFNFDPRSKGVFTVVCQNGETHTFNAGSSEERSRWLAVLQRSRKNAHGIALHDDEVAASAAADLMDFGERGRADSDGEKSTFYLDKEGQLMGTSLVPPPETASTRLIAGIKSLLNESWPEEEPANVDVASAKSHRHSSFRLSPNKSRQCPSCTELLSVVDTLKARFTDISDENDANKELVQILRSNIVSSKAQVQSMQDLAELSNTEDKVSKFLESEKQVAVLRSVEAENKQRIKLLEDDLGVARRDLEAYKESLRSKEELIMRLVDLGGGLEEAVELGDGGGRAMAVVVAGETEVEDLGQLEDLKDAATAYQAQNAFLNKEILELQLVVAAIEAREKSLTKSNFELEGALYQLKSKYLLLLNHLRPSSGHQNSLGLQSSEVESLIGDATRNMGDPKVPTNPEVLLPSLVEETDASKAPKCAIETDSLGFYIKDDTFQATEGSGSGAAIGGRVGLDIVRTAAALNRRASEIRTRGSGQRGSVVQSSEVDWLGRWDAAVVSLSSAANARLSGHAAADFKALLRTSIPHNYRARVWNCMIDWLVGDTEKELGKGYFQSLLKKSLSRRADEPGGDPALKQIDLDLGRTLPGNWHFEDADSAKMESLRRVLYAYRWHNPGVGYCQGLNRLAAVGLLYLEESRAFWFLVSVVECQQPEDYYSPTLATAVADQRVLADLVVEKLPKLGAHLRELETELSLFTLPWFLTAFVDSLPPNIYLPIADVLLYEGNKVLFRFAVGILKLCEARILGCASASALQTLLSRLGSVVPDYATLAHVAFTQLNPFPHKTIESRRQFHLAQVRSERGRL